MDEPRRSIDSGLLCIVLVARFHGLSADESQLAHAYQLGGQALDTGTLIRAARSLKLKARALRPPVSKLDRLRLPAICRMKDGEFAVLARVEDGRVIYQNPKERGPSVAAVEEFAELWSGEMVLLARRGFGAAMPREFNFRWFIPAIIKYKKLLGEVLLASFFIQIFALLTPIFFQVVIDKVLVHRGLTTLDVLAVGMLVLFTFEVVLGGMRTYLLTHTTNRIDVELGAGLFRHLSALPLAYFESRRVGDSVARVRELENIRNFLTGSALTLVVDLFFTFVFIAVMYFYSPTLTLIVVGAIPFYIALSAIITPIFRERLQEKFNRGADNQAFLVESMTGIETVKAMAVEPQLQKRWEEQLAGYVRSAFRSTNLGNIANQTASYINKITTLLILWFGARLVINGELSVGQLVAFNMLAGRVSGPVLRLVQLWQDFQQAGISVARLGDILNVPAEAAYGNRSSLPQLKGHISFDRVTFRYRPDRAEVLKNLSLKISAGEVVGIVGRSGSGKSTLTKLVQRLYVPESGKVAVDGVDLAVVNPAWLRRRVGVVLQDNVLFNRSIRDNIALAEPGLPMDAVTRAAQLAGAHDFIVELPEGYDTIVGEHGASLSGGQRQRVAIARALVTNPKVLIFDEATSALDYESESAIQKNMARICAERTVLIVAHRLSAVRHANRIIVVDKGEIVEQGAHADLVKAGGYYQRLHEMQSYKGADPLLAGSAA